MSDQVTFYLGLGSNIGNKAKNIKRAFSYLASHPEIKLISRSSLYKTAPWGMTDQDWFINAVGQIETALSPHALLDACRDIEKLMGRTASCKWGPRVIDLDILASEGQAMDDDRLTIPHPHMMERPFVLVPLAEIAPDLVVNGASVTAAVKSMDTNDVVFFEGA